MIRTQNDHVLMALEEAEAWKAYDGARGKGGIGPSLTARFGRSAGAIRLRHELYLAGPAATPLWDRIEAGMPLRSAINLLQSARRSVASREISLEKAVIAELSSYEALPGHTFVTADGRVVKRKKPGSEQAVPEETDEARTSSSSRPTPSSDRPPRDGAADPWVRVRMVLDNVSGDLTKGLDQDVATKLLEEFDVEIRRVVTWLKKRAYLSSKSLSEKSLIARPRKDIVSWCHALHIDPPRVGKPVDHELLRRQFRALSLAYHPDRNPGKPEMEEKQRAVNSAYDGLIAYNELTKETE